MIVRELTGGIFYGEHKREGDKAHDIMEYDAARVKPIVERAFKMAMSRSKRVCVVDKANVLECSRLWREVARDFMYVDNASMQLVQKPAFFDVVATDNMFGDILSEIISCLAGSLGLMPSASLGDGLSMYGPVGGSAPDIADQGAANPAAQ